MIERDPIFPPPATPPHFSGGFTARSFAGLLALLIAIPFFPVLFLGNNFVIRDFSLFGYPVAFYHRECFWRGEIPLWNPYSSCGLPFFAQWNTLVFYPGSLVYLLLPAPWSVSFFCLLHLFWAGMGMFFLARHWTKDSTAGAVAGVAFAFNGLLLNSLMWPNNIAALGWMPWVVWQCLEASRTGGKKIWGAILLGAMQMLAGAPEIILFTWFIIGSICAFQSILAREYKRIARLAFVVLWIAAVAAVQLLPFFALLKLSHRTETFGADSWMMPAWGWLNLLVPLFRAQPSPVGVYFQDQQHWTSSYYAGICTLLFALLAISRRHLITILLFAIALGGLVLALGEHGLVYGWINKAIPKMGFMRFPIKFVVLAVFCLPLLAAYGSRKLADPPETRPRFVRAALLIAGIFTLIVVLTVVFAFTHPFPYQQPAATLQNAIVRLVFLAGFLCLIVFRTRLLQTRWRWAFGPLLVLGIWAEQWTHAPPQNPTVRSGVYEPGVIAQRLNPRPAAGGFRAMMSKETHDRLYHSMLPDMYKDYLGRRFSFFGNSYLLDHIPVVDSFFSLYVLEAREIWGTLFFSSTNDFPEPLADFVGIAHVTDPGNMFDWIHRPSPMPLVTIGQKPIFAGVTNTIAALAGRKFDPRREVYLTPGAQKFVSSAGAKPAAILSQAYSKHRLEIKTESAEPALVVVAQTFYPAWKAYVDGRSTLIFHANYAFQAVEVPAGMHTVVLRYEDRDFRNGLIISGLALLGICLGWLYHRRRKFSARSQPNDSI